MSYICLTVLLANSLGLSYFMYINMSDNIGFCLNILHFDWCLCNFVLAGSAFGPVFIVVLNINCLTKNDLSGILDTTDTNFLDPWSAHPHPHLQQGSRKLVSVVFRIPDNSFLVRQFMFKTMIKPGPKAKPAKTKLHRHQSKYKILRQNPIL